MNTISKWPATLALLIALSAVTAERAQAQTLSVLHSFVCAKSTCRDGHNPEAPLFAA
jgi:hypothetical protein